MNFAEWKDIVAMLFDEILSYLAHNSPSCTMLPTTGLIFHGVNYVVCVDKVCHILKAGNLAINNYFDPLSKPHKFPIEYLLPNIDSTIVPQAQIHTRLLQ